jgi:hypothetical protein
MILKNIQLKNYIQDVFVLNGNDKLSYEKKRS